MFIAFNLDISFVQTRRRNILQIRSSSNDDYAANIGMNKVRSVELEDIPLASMEKVMQEMLGRI